MQGFLGTADHAAEIFRRRRPLHKRYTGIPASSRPNPARLLRGYRTVVFSTTNQHAAMKSAVINGWPGTTYAGCAPPARRRNTNSVDAVRPKNRKSIATT